MENLEGEIWKPIILKDLIFTSEYEVSSYGRVRNLNSCKQLKGWINSDGYRLFALPMLNGRKFFKCHVLVIKAFGINIPKGYVIDHNNSNRTDNRLCNLTVMSNRENCSKERTIKSGLPVGVSVSRQKKKYECRIRIENNKLCLGFYNTIELASNIYQIALSTHEQGKPLSEVFQAVDKYRESINLKPIKRRNA
jgi:hypothetical protein